MTTDTKPWGVSENGQIEYRLLTSKYLNQALNVMRDAFFVHENVCRAIKLKDEPHGIKELQEICIRAANDGVSLIAIDKTNDKVIAVAFNKLLVKNVNDAAFFERFLANCTSTKARCLIEYMLKLTGLCDIFQLTQRDCLLEVMFLGTLPECRRKGIGKRLMAISVEIVEQLMSGVNVKQSVNGNSLDLQPVPNCVTAVCTSFITQRIVRQLGFVKGFESSFDIFEYNGQKLGELIEKETPTFTYDYKKL